jgi:hypothetical protein
MSIIVAVFLHGGLERGVRVAENRQKNLFIEALEPVLPSCLTLQPL